MQQREPSPPVAIHLAAGGVLAFGPFRFDTAERLLTKGGAEVALPPRALGVLGLLLERPGKTVAKAQLLAAVWPDACVTETSLAEAVSVLRQALGDDPQRPTYVQTLNRRGYRFIAPVAPVRPEEAPGAPEADGGAAYRGAGWTPGRRWILPALGLLALGAALGALALAGLRPAAPAEAVRRLAVTLPPGDALDLAVSPAFALSPGGDRLVYAGRRDGGQRLYLRALDRFEAVPVPGTEGAAGPFVSPDGEWVGFSSGGSLRKVRLDGGAGGDPVALCDSPYPYGASWGSDGSILFSPDFASGLKRVAAAGGDPETLTVPDRAAGEVGHRWPEVLPGGRAAVFTVWRKGGLAEATVELLDLGTRRRRLLVRGGSFARWSATGHLVFVRGGGLAAVPFDLARLAVSGPPAVVLDGLRLDPAQGGGQFALAAGALAYLPGGPSEEAKALYRARLGEEVRALPLPPRPFRNLALSPDGGRLALTVGEGGRSDLWLAELERTTLSRLTAEGDNAEPVWAPDGRSLAVAAASRAEEAVYNLFRIPADGSGPPRRLLASRYDQVPGSFSPDGGRLAFAELHPETGADLWVLPIGGTPEPFLRTRFAESHPRFSPDGRWLAYQSDESERMEVYVRPYPGPGARCRVSTEGGALPSWSADGTRLFYRRGPELLAVGLEFAGAGARAGRPERLFADLEPGRYAAEPDGRSFLFLKPPPEGAERGRIHLVLGWSGEVARLAPPGR